MKLELKHLAPYLPYNLKMISVNDFVSPLVRELRVDGFQFMLDTRKPILRPLSDLTKEIEVNGVKFVPLLKFAKILGYDDLIKFDYDDGYEFIEYGYVQRYEYDHQPLVFGYWKDGLFSFWYDEKDDSYPINHFTSISAINLLYELHFDVFDLIGAGLAIDINTLKK